MIIKCKSNDGFEDQLTEGKQYQVSIIGNGGADFQVKNDAGELRWYGASKFDLLPGDGHEACYKPSADVLSER